MYYNQESSNLFLAWYDLQSVLQDKYDRCTAKVCYLQDEHALYKNILN